MYPNVHECTRGYHTHALQGGAKPRRKFGIGSFVLDV